MGESYLKFSLLGNLTRIYLWQQKENWNLSNVADVLHFLSFLHLHFYIKKSPSFLLLTLRDSVARETRDKSSSSHVFRRERHQNSCTDSSLFLLFLSFCVGFFFLFLFFLFFFALYFGCSSDVIKFGTKRRLIMG